MKKTVIIAIIFFLTKFSSYGQISKDFLKVKVPKEWIAKIIKYDYKSNNSDLIKDFEKFIWPDTLVLPWDESAGLGDPRAHGGVLNPIVANLDNDEQEEIVALIGWFENYPMLTVFKQIDKHWYLIFTESFHVHYNSPELYIANVLSPNKTFYIRSLYERGTGIFLDTYTFYKLIDNRVYYCHELVNRAYIFGWNLYLNQEVQSTFKFSSSTPEILKVTYDYNFFPWPPLAIRETDVAPDADISFIKRKQSLEYIWDNTSYTYKPFYHNMKNELTEQKVACFGAFGNDSLFVKAFDTEIKQILNEGTELQKKLLTKFLELNKNHSTVPSSIIELEEKEQIGGLKFYGPKKK